MIKYRSFYRKTKQYSCQLQGILHNILTFTSLVMVFRITRKSTAAESDILTQGKKFTSDPLSAITYIYSTTIECLPRQSQLLCNVLNDFELCVVTHKTSISFDYSLPKIFDAIRYSYVQGQG